MGEKDVRAIEEWLELDITYQTPNPPQWCVVWLMLCLVCGMANALFGVWYD